MKPYHSVQISIPPLGEILFQAITLHQGDVIPTQCSYCPPRPVSSAAPLRQRCTWCTSCRSLVTWPRRTPASPWWRSHKGCLWWNFIIIWGVKCITFCSLDEMIICWNDVAHKDILKRARGCHHSHTYCALPHCVHWIHSAAAWLAEHQWSVPAPHSSSLLALRMGRHKLEPWRIHAALILSKTVRGYVGSPVSYLGGQMISTTYPYLPRCSYRNGERSIPAYYYLHLLPSAHKMNHTCQSLFLARGGHVCLYWLAAYVAQLLLKKLALAEVCLCFPLATVQLAGKTASSMHLTNQYKQWSSKSGIMLEQIEWEGEESFWLFGAQKWFCLGN